MTRDKKEQNIVKVLKINDDKAMQQIKTRPEIAKIGIKGKGRVHVQIAEEDLLRWSLCQGSRIACEGSKCGGLRRAPGVHGLRWKRARKDIAGPVRSPREALPNSPKREDAHGNDASDS